MLSFEKWFEVNEDELRIRFAENGADREMDFDFEEESEKVYHQCCGNNLHHMGNKAMYFNKEMS